MIDWNLAAPRRRRSVAGIAAGAPRLPGDLAALAAPTRERRVAAYTGSSRRRRCRAPEAVDRARLDRTRTSPRCRRRSTRCSTTRSATRASAAAAPLRGRRRRGARRRGGRDLRLPRPAACSASTSSRCSTPTRPRGCCSSRPTSPRRRGALGRRPRRAAALGRAARGHARAAVRRRAVAARRTSRACCASCSTALELKIDPRRRCGCPSLDDLRALVDRLREGGLVDAVVGPGAQRAIARPHAGGHGGARGLRRARDGRGRRRRSCRTCRRCAPRWTAAAPTARRCCGCSSG